MKCFKIICLLSVFVLVSASPAIENGSESKYENKISHLTKNQLEETFLKKLNMKCAQKDNSSCVMLKLITYMNRMLKKSTIEINDNFQLTQTRTLETGDEADADPTLMARAATSDDATISVMIADKLWQFFRSRSLKYKLFEVADLLVSTDEGKLNFGFSVDTNQVMESARRRKGHRSALLGAIVMKVALLAALAFKGLILLVGKALLVSKLALLLASVIGIKKLLSKKHVTYEVVAHGHDHHTSHDSYGGSGGWGRAIDGFIESFTTNLGKKVMDDTSTPHDIAYAHQKP